MPLAVGPRYDQRADFHVVVFSTDRSHVLLEGFLKLVFVCSFVYTCYSQAAALSPVQLFDWGNIVKLHAWLYTLSQPVRTLAPSQQEEQGLWHQVLMILAATEFGRSWESE